MSDYGYSGPDDDLLRDDVLDNPHAAPQVNPEEVTAESGNTINSNYIVGGLFGDGIPEDLKKSLKNFTNIHALEMQSTVANLSGEMRMVVAFMNFIGDVSNFRQDGALIASVAQVLDEITDGRVRAMYEKYEAERVLMYTNIVSTFANVFIQVLESTEDIPEWNQEVSGFIETAIQINEMKRDHARNKYIGLCEQLGLEPDESILENGSYSQRTYIERIALGNPPAKSDAD